MLEKKEQTLLPLFTSSMLHTPTVNNKHVIMEIKGGEMTMNEYTYQKLLRKVKSCCSVSESRPNGLIKYRDCKQLLSDNDYIAKIDCRFQCILVRLYPVCCVILRDSILVVANGNMNLDGFISTLCNITKAYEAKSDEASGAHSPQKMMSEELENSIDYSVPFEVRALECCYSASLCHLEKEMVDFEEKFKLVEQMIADKQKYEHINMILHELKQPVANIVDILAGFSGMMDECLSDKNTLKLFEFDSHLLFYGPESLHSAFEDRPVNKELGILMEYYDQEVDQLVRRSRTLGTSLNELEKHLTVVLAIIRNEMMRFELVCSIFSTAFSAGACLTGLFGMNVINKVEDSHGVFIVLAIVTFGMMLLALFITKVLIYRHRV